jgi:ribosomal protein S18 acetylase RimI-like enzyme
MDDGEMGRLADVNLAATWSSLGRSCGAALGGSDECPFVATGIPAAFFNGVYATRRVDDPDAVVGAAIEFMSERAVPWLMWVREGVDDALLDAGRRRRLRDAGGPPAMVLPTIGRVPDRPDGLEIEVVTDRGGLDTFRDVAARGFEMPLEVVERFMTSATLAAPTNVAAIGAVDGVAVSVALASVTGSTVGIYNVATPEEHRRRGYGEAVTWAGIQAGTELGGDHAALQASELGAPVYRSMGFVDVGRYRQLEGPPA